MNKIIYPALVITLISIFTGCQKGIGDPSTNHNAKDILTSGKWHLKSAISIYSILGVNQTVDLLTITPDCYNDNLGIFNTDGSITTDEGPTKCDASAPQQKTEGTWAFSANNTKLTISDPLANSPLTVLAMDVLSINNDAMKLHLFINNSGATTETTYEFSHIK